MNIYPNVNDLKLWTLESVRLYWEPLIWLLKIITKYFKIIMRFSVLHRQISDIDGKKISESIRNIDRRKFFGSIAHGASASAIAGTSVFLDMYFSDKPSHNLLLISIFKSVKNQEELTDNLNFKIKELLNAIESAPSLVEKTTSSDDPRWQYLLKVTDCVFSEAYKDVSREHVLSHIQKIKVIDRPDGAWLGILEEPYYAERISKLFKYALNAKHV